MHFFRRDNGFVHALGSEITSQAVYEDRRNLLRLAAAGAAGDGSKIRRDTAYDASSPLH